MHAYKTYKATLNKNTEGMKFIITLFLLLLFYGCSKENLSNKAYEEMQDFVVNISNYAREYDTDFIIIPQNGIELAFNNTDSNDGLNSTFLSAIDGFGVDRKSVV